MIAKNKHLLSESVTILSGVGPELKRKLSKLGIETIQDILFHLPCRYLDRTRLTPICALRPGHNAYIQGEIELCQIRYGRRRSLLCHIKDQTDSIVLRFFYFSKSQEQSLQRGKIVRCYGQVRRGPKSLEMIHPEYQHIDNLNIALEEQLTPVYPSTEGLQKTRLRKLSDQALAILRQDTTDAIELLPKKILSSQQLPKLTNALEYVHRPPPDADVISLQENRHAAQQRLAYEELLAYQLSLLELRNKLRTEQAPIFADSKKLIPAFLKQLPFKLTDAQKEAYKTIKNDLNQSRAMLRLIQGDVGSGKTIIAALAALQAIEANYQVAIMAPTELLAEQHFFNFKKWLTASKIDIYLLSGKLKKSEKNNTLAQLKQDKPLLIIGTHILFQKTVGFAKLGLVVIDEQHRFGVHQRLALFKKGLHYNKYPHQLIMTATPIPRTLTMAAYADLDHTIINELPPNRKPINTSIISNERRNEIVQRINNICIEGKQAYWVCTLIEESETMQCETAVDTFESLKEKLPSLNVDMIHGRMKHDEKESIMRKFKSGKIHLLVATTVIEVGVDIPNATLMIIENAERLGLSQLHQLRGRIGRGDIKSYCVLMYQMPLGDLARQRLETIRNSNDGFYIAEKDLELRGPGEVLGTRQAGIPTMRIANLIRDARLLPNIQKIAKIMLYKYPDKVKLLIHRWLGNNIDYTHV